MAEKILKTTFLIRRGTSDAWHTVNPILSYGEPGFEKDTNKLKIGDGVTAWNDLSYLNSDFTIGVDGKTIIYNDNSLTLYGYEEAQEGQLLSKGKNNIEWIDPVKPINEEDITTICNVGKE